MLRIAQGGTARLPAIYRDATNALVDPTDPKVDILDTDNVIVVNDAAVVRDSIGEYHYDYAVPALAELGIWTARFSGEISGFSVAGDEQFEVVVPGSVNEPGVNLLMTLEELKDRLGVDPTDNRYDEELRPALASASAAIVAYTQRDFAAPQVTQERTFTYDGSGYLDIDDAASVTEAVLVSTGYTDTTLQADEWVAQPTRRDDAVVFTYLYMPAVESWGTSPEMGFTRNVDVLAAEGRWRSLPPAVKVTATWGWPDVPEDVKQAALWTVQEFRGGGPSSQERLQSEGIEGFNRSWNRQAALAAIPNRAKDLLFAYMRWNV